MSLPGRNTKDYLGVEDTGRGLVIRARKEDADALAAQFLQHGMSCQREPDGAGGRDALRFPEGMDREQVEQILEAYKTAKGS